MTGEPRRIELTTVDTGDKEKDNGKPRKTIRFNLTLTESSEEACPEFSYGELLKNALGDRKKKIEKSGGEVDPLRGPLDPNDPFAQEDDAEHDKMLAIARQFEAKYGPKAGCKKKRTDRLQDLVDLGEGYDDEDPFIDNTEAYDEIVPACLTTRFGGFYINSGQLDFREISDDEDFQPSHKKKKKNRLIMSDNDDDDDDDDNGGGFMQRPPELGLDGKKKRGRKKKVFKDDGDLELLRRKRKKWSMVGGDGKLLKKKKLSGVKLGRPKIKHTPTVAELCKRNQAKVAATTNGLSAAERAQNAAQAEEKRLLMDLEDFGMGNLDPAMDSVINSVLNETTDESPKPVEDNSNPPLLPSDCLSPELEMSIEKIKQAARVTVEGKCKFFTTSVNQLLLDIELRSRQFSSSVRNSIFTHLAAFLPCGKETLLKRAKKLRADLHAVDSSKSTFVVVDQLEPLIDRLQEEINRVMPAQIEHYNTECAVARQRQQEERAENRELGSTESEDEKSNDVGITDKRRLPHRKFQWTDRITMAVNQIVHVKMEKYVLLRTPSQTAEDYLRTFLDAEIRPLWPKGWMQTRMLYKETRGTHGRFTNQAVKLRKALLEQLPSNIHLDANSPLPGGLVISGTKNIAKGSHLAGAPAVVGTTSTGGLVRSASELYDPVEDKLINSMLMTTPSTASTVHLNTKSAPGTPASTSTPAGPTNAVSRTLLDYASDSFLSAVKSKGTVLSMGTVLPDSVPLATSTAATSMSSFNTGVSPVTGPGAGTGAMSSANMLTPATDSLRSISSILKKDNDVLLPHMPQGHQQQCHITPKIEPQLPSPPIRSHTGSYQGTTPVSSRPSNERYINQYKDFVLQKQKQQQQHQQLQPNTSSISTATSSSGPKPFENTTKKPLTSTASAVSVTAPKTNWDLQHLGARSTASGALTSQSSMGSGLHSMASSLASSHKVPSTQTQVHQVSSSLNKTQEHHGLKVAIPSSGQGQNLTMGQRLSPGQSITSDNKQQQQPQKPQQQRQVQSQNLSLGQRSPQGQSQTVTSPQSRSYQGQAYHDNIRKSVPPSSPTPRGSHSSVGGSGMSSNVQLSSGVRQSQQVMGLASMSRSSSQQSAKTTVSGSSGVHSPSKANIMPSSPVAPHSPMSPQSVSGYSSGGQKRHVTSPSSGVTNMSYKAAITSKVGSGGGGVQQQHNGGQRGPVTSPTPSTTNSTVTSRSHILDAHTVKKQKSKAPSNSNDIVYSSLTMAQIIASSPPSDSRKHYPPTCNANKSTTDSSHPIWTSRGAEAHKIVSATRPSTVTISSPGLQSSGIPSTPCLPVSSSSAFPMPGSPRTVATTANMFMPPTTASALSGVHSGLRLSDLQRETAVCLSQTSGLQLTPANMSAYSHGSPVHSVQSLMSTTTPSPHHAHSPQQNTVSATGASPRHHLYQNTVTPFGYPYSDPNQPPQHRY